MRIRKPTVPGNRLGMPIEDWPLTDQQAWQRAFSADLCILEGDGLGRDLRPATRIVTATCYARWLVWIRTTEPSLLASPPSGRVTRERLTGYVRALQTQVQPRTIYGYLSHLRRALALIAPEQDWSWFRPLLKNLERLARRAHTMRHNFIPSKKLFGLGLSLMQQAEAAESLPPVQRAELYRDGLAVAFLGLRPLRLGNMLALEIGTHILEVSGGYRVFLPSTITKSHADLEFLAPDALTPWIARYLACHRRILLAGPFGPNVGYVEHINHLWLARSGQQFPVASFEAMIVKHTLGEFGIRLTPHGFRHCAATSIAENDTENYHTIRIILGHATIRTAEKHYIHAKAGHAARLVQNNLISVRNALACSDRPVRRGRQSIAELSRVESAINPVAGA